MDDLRGRFKSLSHYTAKEFGFVLDDQISNNH